MKKIGVIALSTILVSSAIFAIYKTRVDRINIKTREGVGMGKGQGGQEKIKGQGNYQSLSVDGNRCRGCGKCIRIDREHFELSLESGKAVVISSGNLDSRQLKMAINSCPAGAIALN